MNLKQTLMWKILAGISLLTIFFYAYNTGYNNYSRYKNELQKTKGAKQGTDEGLMKKITVLEEKLKEKDENKFVIINNPTALSRIVKIKGLEDEFQSSSNIVKTLVIYGRESNLKAIVSYDGAKYTVLQGDSIAGGIIEVIDHEKLVFVKDGVKKMHYYNKKNKKG